MDQVLQIVGALLILVPFAAAQFGRMSTASAMYLVLNLLGSALLLVLAAMDGNWGFVLLEGAWGAVSAWSLGQLVGHAESRPAAAP